MTTHEILLAAKAQRTTAATLSDEQKSTALCAMADCLEEQVDIILENNNNDVNSASEHISEVMLDRLRLTHERVADMADSLRAVARLADPVGRVLSHTVRPDGLAIDKVSVPIGVVAIIYESRPNVTSDAAALALRSGNVCVLRGGKEAYFTNRAIVGALRGGLARCGLPVDIISCVEDTSRESAHELMTAVGLVDLLIPRGGAGLIRTCTENAKVPCIQTGTGICHIYVDKSADLEMALNIIENAKTQRPSVCNAAEVCLVHKDIADKFLPMLKARLVDSRVASNEVPVELRLCERAAAIIDGSPAGADDFDTEFLDYIMAVRVVDDLKEAVRHIADHSTGHSEAIVTDDAAAADQFTAHVDSAAVYVNASTRFTDGGQFGLGCEMGISTQRLHARGPMGLAELNTYKFVIHGDGQIRK